MRQQASAPVAHLSNSSLLPRCAGNDGARGGDVHAGAKVQRVRGARALRRLRGRAAAHRGRRRPGRRAARHAVPHKGASTDHVNHVLCQIALQPCVSVSKRKGEVAWEAGKYRCSAQRQLHRGSSRSARSLLVQSVLHALLSRSPVSFAQVQKAKRHEQRVAVCVVRAASGGGGGGGPAGQARREGTAGR